MGRGGSQGERGGGQEGGGGVPAQGHREKAAGVRQGGCGQLRPDQAHGARAPGGKTPQELLEECGQQGSLKLSHPT